MLIAQTEAEELPTVSVNPYFSFGPVTKAVSEMKQHLGEFGNEELVKVAKSGEGGSCINMHCQTNEEVTCHNNQCPENPTIILHALERASSII